MIIFEYQNSILLIVKLDSGCYCSRWYPTICFSAYTSSTSWTAILREQYSLSQLGHVDCDLFSLSCSSLWLWKASSRVNYPKFGMCCLQEQIQLPPLQPLTGILHNYLTGNDYSSREFHNNIRQYNAAFAMTSVGVKIDNSVTRQSGPYCFKIKESFIISLVLFFLMVIKLQHMRKFIFLIQQSSSMSGGPTIITWIL